MPPEVLSPFIDLATLRTTLPRHPITRFAPSPTGLLHLGHAVHALYCWGVAQGLKATIKLRLEDHDRQRSKAAFATSIVSDLEWLGLLASPVSVQPLLASPAFECQSSHPQRYQQALLQLQSAGLLYYCQCSRKDLQEAPEGEPYYPGHCRDLGLAAAPGRSLRFKLARNQAYSFSDYFQGLLTMTPSSQCGDFVVVDKQGQYSYQLAVVSDDLYHGINLIVRGEDLLASTARQLALRTALDPRAAPVSFIHHPLLYELAGGPKLSKRLRSLSIAALRAQGLTSSQLWGRAAHAIGLLPREQQIRPADFATLLQGPS